RTPETNITSRSADRRSVESSGHALPPGRERFGFSDSEANSQARRVASGRKGKGHEPAGTIPQGAAPAQARGAHLTQWRSREPSRPAPGAPWKDQRPDRPASPPSAR